jgi:hypothetical protein
MWCSCYCICLALAHHECNRCVVQHAGSTPATRKAAAEQLGEVVRLQPHELHRLLARIHPYLRSKTWDTRIAAGQACVQSHTDPSRSFARACACHDIFSRLRTNTPRKLHLSFLSRILFLSCTHAREYAHISTISLCCPCLCSSFNFVFLLLESCTANRFDAICRHVPLWAPAGVEGSAEDASRCVAEHAGGQLRFDTFDTLKVLSDTPTLTGSRGLEYELDEDTAKLDPKERLRRQREFLNRQLQGDNTVGEALPDDGLGGLLGADDLAEADRTVATKRKRNGDDGDDADAAEGSGDGSATGGGGGVDLAGMSARERNRAKRMAKRAKKVGSTAVIIDGSTMSGAGLTPTVTDQTDPHKVVIEAKVSRAETGESDCSFNPVFPFLRQLCVNEHLPCCHSFQLFSHAHAHAYTPHTRARAHTHTHTHAHTHSLTHTRTHTPTCATLRYPQMRYSGHWTSGLFSCGARSFATTCFIHSGSSAMVQQPPCSR